MTLWSGRFEGGPDPAAFDFGISFGFNRALFEDDVIGSLAWAEALGAAGVLSADDTRAIIAGLEAILGEGRRDPAAVAGPDEDVHSFVERKLIERIGEAGRRLHTGRSRNEQVSLDLRLYLRRRIPALQHGIATLVAACVDQAQVAGAALMPSYTHLRRAQPVLVAHFFLSHAAALRRDHARLAAAAEEANALTLGSGAIAGTSYPVDTARLARTLGFTRVVRNSMDASSDRDFVAAFLFSASLAMVHLSRLAEDLILFTGEEHGFFELSDASATGSSMMPQKKNPDPLELVRGKAGRAVGRLTGWLVTMKGLPSGYNKDLQEDKEAVFDAETTLAAIPAGGARRLVAAGDQPGAHVSGGFGPAARNRCGGLPGGARHGVPACARDRGSDGAASPRRGARFQRSVDGRMARGQRDVRRRCAACGHGARVGAGPPYTAVDQSGRRPRRIGRVLAMVGDGNWKRRNVQPNRRWKVPGCHHARPDHRPKILRNRVLGVGSWELVVDGAVCYTPGTFTFNIPPEGTAPGEFHAATPASAR